LPLLEDPELKIKRPLDPVDPAFKLFIIITPLVEAVPSPLATLTAPPDLTVLDPACACNEPPAPLVPLPTPIMISPDRPIVAIPVPKYMAPEFPLIVDPLEKTRAPLAPAAPPLTDAILIPPLLV
jgi:hypothetical protein